MATKIIKVLLVDDHELMRSGLKHMLSVVEGIKVVGEATNGEEAVLGVRQFEPEIVIMDIKLPKMNGFEAAEKILRSQPEMKVIVVTGCNDNIYPSKFLDIGVMGYLTKESSIEEVVHAIKAVSCGQRYITQSIAQNLLLEKVDTAAEESPFTCLSTKELQVALRVGRGETHKRIARSMHLSSKTINSYRYRAFKKLKVKNDVEMAALLIRHGLIEN